jgi:hypothetical protein
MLEGGKAHAALAHLDALRPDEVRGPRGSQLLARRGAAPHRTSWTPPASVLRALL